MSTPTEEITLDLDALDAAAAAKVDPAKIDKTPEPEVKVETAAPPDDATDPNKGLEKLRKDLDSERAARIAAESRANEATAAEVEARTRAQSSELDHVKAGISQLTQAKEVLKTKYAEAAAAADWAAAAEVQAEMADNAANLRDLNRAKTNIEKAPKPTPRAPVDPVEKFAAELTPQSAAWVRAHPEYVRDPAKNKKMIAAHQIAIADGLQADTPEYFKSIEDTLKIGPIIAKPPVETHDDDPMAAAAQPANGSRQAAPAAPVSRSATNNSGSRPSRVTLTPAQIEAAHYQFPDSKTPLEDYARNLAALRKEGKLS